MQTQFLQSCTVWVPEDDVSPFGSNGKEAMLSWMPLEDGTTAIKWAGSTVQLHMTHQVADYKQQKNSRDYDETIWTKINKIQVLRIAYMSEAANTTNHYDDKSDIDLLIRFDKKMQVKIFPGLLGDSIIQTFRTRILQAN